MSCHDIGHAADHMVNCIYEKYDEGKLDTDTARSLIRSAVGLTRYCDGNEYEAYETAGACRCGCCLRKLNQGEKLYQIDYSVENQLWEKGVNLEDFKAPYAYGVLCEDCIKRIFPDSVVNDIINEHNADIVK